MGEGAFADVFLVEHRILKSKYALKRVDKSEIESEKDRLRAINERKIMEINNHPFIINLHCAFQTDKFLYYIMDFADGGEMFTLLRRKGKFQEKTVQLYSAEIILALGHLHSNDILYSDLKLENILIDKDGHILLTDFGLSQFNDQQYSIIGTREYLAPEAIKRKPITKAIDWWALVI